MGSSRAGCGGTGDTLLRSCPDYWAHLGETHLGRSLELGATSHHCTHYVSHLYRILYGTQFRDEGERTRRISAVLGIAAFLNVPIIYVSVKFWAADAQLHPQPAMSQQSPDVFWTFMLSLLVFTLLFVHLNRFRVHILKLRSKVLGMRYDV